jgi:hypothetical protein
MKRGLFTGALVGGLCVQAQAAWLQICPADNIVAPGRPQVQITRPENTALLASITDKPASAGCQQLELAVSANDVLGLLPITAQLSAELTPWLSLSGKTQGTRFLFGEVTAGQPARTHAAAPQPLPLRSNLLDSLNATTFGAEKRARVTRANGQLSMQCTPGTKPAGLVLSANAYQPRARTQLQISGSGSGRFEIVTVNAEQAAIESGSRLGYFSAQRLARTQVYDLSTRRHWQDWQGWRHWTLACPADSAQLQLNALELIPQTVATPARAAWIWRAGEWQDQTDAVLRRANKYALRTLYITIPLKAGTVQNPERLAAFIRRAGAAGIDVWAVDGDPNMVQLQERPATLERARAYARFNRTMPPEARLKGVQFDVEPYLLAGYELATDAWEQRYAELVKALHASDPDIAQGRLALEMVVPFWWSDKPDLLDAMASWVTGLVVMDYRTDASEIYRFAVPFLDWGERHGKTVHIALEAGPIAPETRYRYEQAPQGELWQVQLGEQHFLLMLRSARPNPLGAAFRLVSSYEISGRATTFHGDTARLLRQLPELESIFSAWPGFGGMALHELR